MSESTLVEVPASLSDTSTAGTLGERCPTRIAVRLSAITDAEDPAAATSRLTGDTPEAGIAVTNKSALAGNDTVPESNTTVLL